MNDNDNKEPGQHDATRRPQSRFAAGAIDSLCVHIPVSAVDDEASTATADPVNPSHYRQHPSGVECIEITEHFNFNLGNAIKYIWRGGLKGRALEDLEKARWYISREIERITK